MGYCSSVFSFGSPLPTKFRNQATPASENEKPEQEDARFVKLQATSPRTSKVASYSSNIPSLGARLCAWVRASCNNLNSARLKFGYENACKDALIALNLALVGGNGYFSKAQLLNFQRCYERRVHYFKLQTLEEQTKLRTQFVSQIDKLISAKKGDFNILLQGMKTLRREDHNSGVNQGYGRAAAICKSIHSVCMRLPEAAKDV
jgi:hypothetical protein